MLEDVVFRVAGWSGYHSNPQVAYTSFHSWYCLWTEQLNLLNK